MYEYLKELNENQLKAVTSNKNKILVLAGAGSGKTKTLTARIRYLLDLGVNEENIIAFTFTNKAAREMQHRLKESLNRETNVSISTFHSFCFKDMRFYKNELGYTDFPKVLTDEQRSNILKQILNEFGIKKANTSFFNNLSKIKNNVIIKNITREESILLNKVYHRYQEILIETNSIDFDDMIPMYLKILKSNNDYALNTKYNAQYILVDECQDTNQIQYDLINELASIHKRIFMVGDDAQLIYSFRSSDKALLEGFKNNCDDLIILNQNYRCAKNILELANNLISNNESLIDKKLYSTIDTVSRCRFKEFATAHEEALMVTNLIQSLMNKGYNPKDIAIIFRNNNQSYLIEKELTAQKIPYEIYGHKNFMDNKEIMHLVSIYRVILNPKDLISLQAVCINPIYGMEYYAYDSFIKSYDKQKDLFDQMINFNNLVINKFGNKLKELKDDFNLLSNEEFFMKILDLFYYKDYINNTDDKIEKYERIMTLKTYIKETNKENLLEMFSMLSIEDDNKKAKDRISLLTIHKSKGLEFKCVIIIGCNEGIIPPLNISNEAKAEERRLLYVAITRAREILYITSSQLHYLNDFKRRYQPSSFLLETGLFGTPLKKDYYYN